MNAISWTTLLCAVALALGACERRNEGPPRPAPSADQPVPTPRLPPAPTRPAPAHPPAADGAAISGSIVEAMDSGGYTYVKLATGKGEQWAAIPQSKVVVGDQVTIENVMEMTAFQSSTLGRTFDVIWFGTLGSATAPVPSAPAAASGVAKVARADGATGRTVAEVVAQKAALAGKPVAIRGQVTKFNADIMGKNWLHLQDGTGVPGQDDFDLMVTTADTAAVGDVVVVRGVVRIDQDFGAGYAYAVLVEDATLER